MSIGDLGLSPPVALTVNGEVALLELARPEVLNALDEATNRAILYCVRELEADGQTRVMVIAGRGRAFCAGADLKHMRGLSGVSLRRFIELTWAPLEALAHSPIISIAALHGHVLGGGAELALACDMRVAETNMSFGFPEMTLGSVPGSSGMQRLPEFVGRARALELVVTGARLDAKAALGLNLVNRIAGQGETAREAAMVFAAEIAARPAESLRYAKLAMRMSGRHDVAAAFHGLVSSVRQSDPSYREQTERFQDGAGGRVE